MIDLIKPSILLSLNPTHGSVLSRTHPAANVELFHPDNNNLDGDNAILLLTLTLTSVQCNANVHRNIIRYVFYDHLRLSRWPVNQL